MSANRDDPSTVNEQHDDSDVNKNEQKDSKDKNLVNDGSKKRNSITTNGMDKRDIAIKLHEMLEAKQTLKFEVLIDSISKRDDFAQEFEWIINEALGKEYEHPLIIRAICHGNTDIVKLLLQHKVYNSFYHLFFPLFYFLFFIWAVLCSVCSI